MIYIYYRHDNAKQSKTKHFKSCVLILDTAIAEVVDFSAASVSLYTPPY